MRLVVDSLIALMVMGMAGGILWFHHHEQHRRDRVRRVQAALSQLYEQALYHGALADHDREHVTEEGFAVRIDPRWFAQAPPRNAEAADHPWLEIAPADDSATNPPDPVLRRPDQAGFWYNPWRGVFRARVTPQQSDRQTLAWYNRVNGTSLVVLPSEPFHTAAPGRVVIADPRQPGAHAATDDATPGVRTASGDGTTKTTRARTTAEPRPRPTLLRHHPPH